MTTDATIQTTPAGWPTMEELARDYYEVLRRFALHLAGDPDVAADLTQQTFYLALRHESQLREPERARSWLHSILHREFLQKIRRQQRRPETSLEEAGEAAEVAVSQIDRLDAATVKVALAELDPRFREPLAMFYLEDLSYREIAGRLALPIGTVMSRLSRGKNLLRQNLSTATRRGAL